MAKFYGFVGYGVKVEKSKGVWVNEIVEKPYYGDILNNSRKLETGEGVNDNININNSISIVSDPYAQENFFAIVYVKWAGTYWKVPTVTVQGPRLILRLGGVYNGPKA